MSLKKRRQVLRYAALSKFSSAFGKSVKAHVRTEGGRETIPAKQFYKKSLENITFSRLFAVSAFITAENSICLFASLYSKNQPTISSGSSYAVLAGMIQIIRVLASHSTRQSNASVISRSLK